MGAVFLDLDGTLTDPKPGITAAVRYALAGIGLPVPDADALEWVIGPPLLESFAKLGAPRPELALELYRKHYSAQGLFDCDVYPGIAEALQSLRDLGHRLFLATAKPHIYATSITAHFGLDRHLDAQFGPDLDGTRNDKGALLEYALAKLGLDPADAVMIGDRDNDLNAARRNGMAFIGVDWGYAAAGELDDADEHCAAPGALAKSVAALLKT